MSAKVLKITRTRGSTVVLVQNNTRKIEYILGALGAIDVTDEILTHDFEESPKAAAIKYDAQIDLV